MSQRNKWWTLLVVCIGTLMLLLDVTVVNVALKSIQQDLHSSFSDQQWVIDAYALTLASFLLIFGSLADIFGRRLIFMVGIVIFTLASLTCSLATTPSMLTYSRAIQGIGGAAMFSTALALIGQEFQGRERGTAFGIWGATTGAAVAIGPLVGGALTDGFGWSSIFFVNIPVGIIALGLTLAKVKNTHDHRPGARVDFIGFVSFAMMLFLFIYALVRGNLDGWGSAKIVGCFLTSAVLLAVFLFTELKIEQPMLDLRLFRKPTFVGASIAALALSGSIFSLFLYVSLYFQNVLGYAPFATGLRFLPTTVVSFIVAGAAGKLSAYFPAKAFLSLGLFIIAAGLCLFWAVNSHSTWLAVMPGLTIAGFGVGLTNPPLASTAIGVVEPVRAGMASGINSTFRQLGIATGIAGLGAIFEHTIDTGVAARFMASGGDHVTATQLAKSVTGGRDAIDVVMRSIPDPLKGAAVQAINGGFVQSFDQIAVVGALIALIGAVCSVILVRQSDFVAVNKPQGSQTAAVGAEP